MNELASAAGMHDVIDPILLTALKAQRSGNAIVAIHRINFIHLNRLCCISESNEDEHLSACLLLVFIAVSLPRLARSESSMYR